MGCSVCGKCAHCGGLGEWREEREEGKHPDWETPGGLTQWHPVKVSIVFKSRFLVDKDMLSYLIYKKMKVIFKITIPKLSISVRVCVQSSGKLVCVFIKLIVLFTKVINNLDLP